MTQSKIKSIIGTLVVLGVIVAWASGNNGPQDTIGLKYDEDDVSNCSNSCQTREVTYYGCQNCQSRGVRPLQKVWRLEKRYLRLAGRFRFLL